MLRFTPKLRAVCLLDRFTGKMSKAFLIKSLAAIFLAFTASLTLSAQNNGSIPYKSQEMSEKDGVPVLMEHLPEWETVRKRASFSKSVGDLKNALGDRKILDLVDFTAGTEAASASYDAGKLLVIEYTSPQASVEADNKFKTFLAETSDGATVYRRIGNYNVLVFDANDKAAAESLIDQVKYEKQVQWLGNNPFHISPERAFVLTTSDIFLSTVFVIVMGIGLSVVGGLIAGLVFFSLREHRRAGMPTFSDAGGMIRLNLDGFTPDVTPNRYLQD
jgi:hypothetical protein